MIHLRTDKNCLGTRFFARAILFLSAISLAKNRASKIHLVGATTTDFFVNFKSRFVNFSLFVNIWQEARVKVTPPDP